MCCCFLLGRLEETEEELVQLKIEREAERQRRTKYGTANGAAVEAINSTETPGETGEGGGEAGETSKAPAGEQTTGRGKWLCMKFKMLIFLHEQVSIV